MMEFTIIFFWACLAIVFYSYFGYGLLVLLVNGFKKIFNPVKNNSIEFSEPPVTIIISAYNEEEVLVEKIENTLSIDYPLEKLQIIFITDGSTDDSERILSQYPQISVMHQPERKGKYAAIKRVMQRVNTPIVVFSDANSMLNKECIRNIIPHFQDKKVGAVAGEKKIIGSKTGSSAGDAERLYWKYESFMKKRDAELYSVAGAAGELFSIRTGLFEALDDDVILDDFIISMQICMQGYKIAYEQSAYATELPSASLAEEEKRKVRISAGAFQAIGYLKECLNFLKHPLLAFQFFSRRILRWIFCPPMFLFILISNILIVFRYPESEIYRLLLFAQSVFYLLAFFGWIIARSGRKANVFTIPFYFVFMNYCLAKGFVKFIHGQQSVLWEKSLRQAVE
jgi:poly-beta-1,6-N-acetyl-D-glucosamine synthase